MKDKKQNTSPDEKVTPSLVPAAKARGRKRVYMADRPLTATERSRLHRQRNRDKYNAQQRKWRKGNPEKVKAINIRKKIAKMIQEKSS